VAKDGVIADVCARARGLGREPAHHSRRVGCKKVIARGIEIDVTQVRRIQTHAVDAPDEWGRQRLEQGNLLDGLLDQDAGGVEFFAGIRALFDDGDIEARARERVGTGETAETRADDRAIAGALRVTGSVAQDFGASF